MISISSFLSERANTQYAFLCMRFCHCSSLTSVCFIWIIKNSWYSWRFFSLYNLVYGSYGSSVFPLWYIEHRGFLCGLVRQNPVFFYVFPGLIFFFVPEIKWVSLSCCDQHDVFMSLQPFKATPIRICCKASRSLSSLSSSCAWHSAGLCHLLCPWADSQPRNWCIWFRLNNMHFSPASKLHPEMLPNGLNYAGWRCLMPFKFPLSRSTHPVFRKKTH